MPRCRELAKLSQADHFAAGHLSTCCILANNMQAFLLSCHVIRAKNITGQNVLSVHEEMNISVLAFGVSSSPEFPQRCPLVLHKAGHACWQLECCSCFETFETQCRFVKVVVCSLEPWWVWFVKERSETTEPPSQI